MRPIYLMQPAERSIDDTGFVSVERTLSGTSWRAHADRHQKSADAVLWGRCLRTGQRRRFFEIGFRSSPSWSLILHSQQGLSDDGAPCCMELAEQCVAAMGRSRLLLWLGVASLHSLHGSTAGGHDISTRCHTLTTLPHSSSAASSSRGIEAAWADGGPKFTCSRR